MGKWWKDGGSSWVIVVAPFAMLVCYQVPAIYSHHGGGCNSSDMKALLAFTRAMESMAIAGWDLNHSKLTSIHCCSWAGVWCNASSGRVAVVSLPSMGLKGSIPEGISGLDELTVLDLSNNSLRGGVPSGLLGLPRLQALDLSMNNLSGHMQQGYSSYLPLIRTFNVSFNRFEGPHPVLLGSSELDQLDVRGNQFTGAINAIDICAASPRIRTISLSGNYLSGEFPYGFGSCVLLSELMLDSNSISGGLPDDLFRLASLEHLFLQQNQLNGTLPSGVGNLTALVMLDLSWNGFSGTIPNVFGPLMRLRYLSAASNKFMGALPTSLSNLSSIEVLNFRRNWLDRMITDIKFSNMPSLSLLNLGSNFFNGPIPGELSFCAHLQTLNLALNLFTGGIPDGFANMSSLSFLSAPNNYLMNISGALRTLQHCPNLTALVLTLNFHGERIPVDSGIQGFRSLKLLVIAYCGLYGSLPSWLEQSRKLQLLDLSWNRLEGVVPSWIGELTNLFYLDLSNNSLSGQLPVSLSNLSGLITTGSSSSKTANPPTPLPFFSKQSNHATSLRYNQLTSFPPTIDFSTNNLSGPILPGFCFLTELHVMDLSVNNFSGPIPENLSEMTTLECLNLSHNALTGTIPRSLNSLTFLSKFSVAYNSLDGPIPDGVQLLTFAESSYEGNRDLCGSPLKSCGTDAFSANSVNEDERSGIAGSEFKLAILFAFTPAFLAGFVLGLQWKSGTPTKRSVSRPA